MHFIDLGVRWIEAKFKDKACRGRGARLSIMRPLHLGEHICILLISQFMQVMEHYSPGISKQEILIGIM